MIIRNLLFGCLLVSSYLFSQIAVTNNFPMDSEEYIVNNVLLGDDLVTSNFSSVGFANGIGYFDGFNSNIGFEEGIILSSGGLELVTDGFGVGSGVTGDSDLELALTQINLNWDVNNVTILEFDFVAESESVAFNYVFGSVEYTGYTCSVFNDIFGFFLSGPGIIGPYSNNAINLAYIPDPANPGQYTTTPVAVNTVNSGTPSGFDDSECVGIDPNWEDYNVYWIDNDYAGADWQGVNQPPIPEFTVEGLTGFTTPLKAEYNGLTCGETYHIKLAIADASDFALNSVVFLEANSFISPSVIVNPLSNIDGPDLFGDSLAIYEGCAAAQLEFSASGNLDYDIVLEVLFEGDTDYGVDFDVTYNGGNALDPCINNDGNQSQCITIPAGQETMYIDIQAYYDEENETAEGLSVVINAITGLCEQAELAVSEIDFNLYDQIPIVVDPGDIEIIECFGDEVTLSPESIFGGYIGDSGSYTYQWYDQEGTQIGASSTLMVATSEDIQYQLVVYDDCQDQAIETNFSVNVIEYSPIVLDPLSYSACDGDIVTVNPVLNGGSEDYSYVWPDSPTPCDCTSFDFTYELSNGENQNIDFQVIDNCSGVPYEFQIPIGLNATEPPSVFISTIGEQFCPGDEIVLDAQTIGESTYSYEWMNISSDEYYVNNIANISPDFDTTYEVIVVDDCNGNSSIFSIDIETPEYDPPSFTISDLVGCVGQELELDVQDLVADGVQSNEDYSFLWSTGSVSPSIQVTVEEEPTYYSVTVSDLCGNTSLEAEAMISASIPPPPVFTFDQFNDTVQFNQLTEGFFTNFEWDLGDGNYSYEYEPIHVYSEEGDYYISLVASDDFGCTNYYNGIVNIASQLLFYAPDIFSPNSDGVNDAFNVSVVGHDDFQLFVFDRWGKELFTTTDPNEGWPGTYPDGKEVPQDIYMYKVIMSNKSVGEKIERGRISIIK